jgi:hypothetical protein
VVLVHTVCQKYGITKGSITVGCDGLSALLQALDYDDDVDPTSQQFDIIAAIHYWRDLSPVQWKSRHILGHQDDAGVPTVLDRWATLNCEMDASAKAHWEHCHLQPQPNITISGEPWQLLLPSGKVCRNFRSQLLEHIFAPEAKSYWDRKGRFAEGSSADIDWPAVGDARRAMPRARQHWQTKHNSGFCGVGKMMLQRKERDSAKCPRCDHELEDTEHVILCQGSGTSEVWQAQMRAVATELTKLETDPQLHRVIMAGLNSYRSSEPFTLNSLRPEIQSVVALQSRVGWRNLLEGFPVLGWADIQQQSYDRNGSKRTGRRWITALVKKLAETVWNMWDHRNSVNTNNETSLASIEINNRIIAEYNQGFWHLPKDTRKQIKQRSEILAAPLSTRRHWLYNISVGRRFAEEQRLRNIPPPGVSYMDWVRAGRPPDGSEECAALRRYEN